jgi:hypothetical protein
MLKRIPKSDISIRPFKAYKNWSFNQDSTEISLVEANISSSELSNGFQKNSAYGQLRAQFYNGDEFNPILRVDSLRNTYVTNSVSRDRYLADDAKVISIPQIYVGEGIKKGSLLLINGDGVYTDDTNGNIIDASGDTLTITRIDVEENLIYFNDIIGTPYTASYQTAVGDFSNQLSSFNLVYQGSEYDMTLIKADVSSAEFLIDNVPFLVEEGSVRKVGNIFYTNGLLTITRDSKSYLTSSWDLSYKSTETIYEHEYLLIVNQDEFNVSQNPSAIVEVGKEVGFVTGSDGKIYKAVTNAGTKYIRKKSILENGDILDYRFTGSISSSITNTWISGGFEHYDLSSSVDSTGSFLAPFITTIGLYDDNCDLVAVAKLPQPIKSEPDIPVNFIVRFDT